jgi:hypothetical protein
LDAAETPFSPDASRVTKNKAKFAIKFFNESIIVDANRSFKKKFVGFSHPFPAFLLIKKNKTCLGRFQDCGRGKGKNM